VLPEVEDNEVAGVAALAMAAKLKRGVEIARNRKAKSSGRWRVDKEVESSRALGIRVAAPHDPHPPIPPFKYRRLHNGHIQNQWPDQIGPGIFRWMEQGIR
jgi:hypothetical protein